MLLPIVFLLSSIALLIVISNFIVDIMSRISRDFSISMLIISIVIVGFGTSLPEFVVSITLGAKGEIVLSFGNIIGSNTFNILFAIGVSCLIYPISKYNINNINNYFLILSSIALIALVLYGKLSTPAGIGFMIAIVAYIISLIVVDHKSHKPEQHEKPLQSKDKLKLGLKFAVFAFSFLVLTYLTLKFSSRAIEAVNTTITQNYSKIPSVLVLGLYTALITALAAFANRMSNLLHKTPFYLVISALALSMLFVALINASDLVYINSTELAHIFNVPEKIIAILVLSVGTSLPELSFSIVSSIKRQGEIIIGNVIGSNIFNVLLVLGTVNTLRAGEISRILLPDSIVVLFSSLILAYIVMRNKTFTRMTGVLFIAIYFGYLILFVV